MTMMIIILLEYKFYFTGWYDNMKLSDWENNSKDIRLFSENFLCN